MWFEPFLPGINPCWDLSRMESRPGVIVVVVCLAINLLSELLTVIGRSLSTVEDLSLGPKNVRPALKEGGGRMPLASAEATAHKTGPAISFTARYAAKGMPSIPWVESLVSNRPSVKVSGQNGLGRRSPSQGKVLL